MDDTHLTAGDRDLESVQFNLEKALALLNQVHEELLPATTQLSHAIADQRRSSNDE